MIKAAVDSSVILDVLLDDQEFAEASVALLDRFFSRGALVICPVAYAECAASLLPPSKFTEIGAEMGLAYEDFTPESCISAGALWQEYRSRGGPRRRILADFLIGAHAAASADVLLTRDRGFFRSYFRDLEVVEPDSR